MPFQFSFFRSLDHKLTFNVNSDKKLLKISDIDFTVGKLLAKGNANFHFQDNKVDLKIKLLDKTFSLATNFQKLDLLQIPIHATKP